MRFILQRTKHLFPKPNTKNHLWHTERYINLLGHTQLRGGDGGGDGAHGDGVRLGHLHLLLHSGQPGVHHTGGESQVWSVFRVILLLLTFMLFLLLIFFFTCTFVCVCVIIFYIYIFTFCYLSKCF